MAERFPLCNHPTNIVPGPTIHTASDPRDATFNLLKTHGSGYWMVDADVDCGAAPDFFFEGWLGTEGGYQDRFVGGVGWGSGWWGTQRSIWSLQLVHISSRSINL